MKVCANSAEMAVVSAGVADGVSLPEVVAEVVGFRVEVSEVAGVECAPPGVVSGNVVVWEGAAVWQAPRDKHNNGMKIAKARRGLVLIGMPPVQKMTPVLTLSLKAQVCQILFAA